MHLPKELMEGVETLIRRFGNPQFQEAAKAAAIFSPSAMRSRDERWRDWDHAVDVPERFTLDYRDSSAIALLRDGFFAADALDRVDVRVKITGMRPYRLIDAMKACDNRRLKWAREYGISEESNMTCGLLGELSIKSESYDNIQQILDQPSIAVFRRVSIYWSGEMIKDDMMLRLQRIVSKEGLVQRLRFYGCTLSPYHCTLLQLMLQSNHLNELRLFQTEFSNDSICLDHLIDGLQSVPRTQTASQSGGLEILQLWSMPALCGEQPSFDHQCRLLRSLGGLPDLKYLSINLAITSGELPTILGTEVLQHPECRIQSLDLFWERPEGDAEVANDEVGARFDGFFAAFQQNTSVRHLAFNMRILTNSSDSDSLPDSIMGNLFKMAMSPRKGLRCISVGNQLLIDLDLMKFVDPNENVDGSKAHLCQIRRFIFADLTRTLLDMSNVQRAEQNIDCTIHLLTKRTPYLFNIGIRYRSWFKNKIASMKNSNTLLRKWNDLWLCLERNRAGIALLHPSVAASVPTSLWPTVLAKTTLKFSSRSKNAEKRWEEKEDHPLDGLFSVVQGLFAGRHLTSINKDAVENVDNATAAGGQSSSSKKRLRLE